MKKSCVTRKESQTLGVSLSTKGVWRRGPSCIIPDPRISCSIYCSQKSTSSPTKVIPWIVWPPAGCQFSPQCDLCVGPSFPSKQDRKFKEIMRPVSSVRTEEVALHCLQSPADPETMKQVFPRMTHTILLSRRSNYHCVGPWDSAATLSSCVLVPVFPKGRNTHITVYSSLAFGASSWKSLDKDVPTSVAIHLAGLLT